MAEMNLSELHDIAIRMVAPGKGILAADESTGTIEKRLDGIGVESTEDSRRDYRELLFRAENAMRQNISGVILYDETIRQSAKDGTKLVKLITDAGAIPGIKVDKGAKPLAFCPGETVTEGLDGLRGRLSEYYELGARFAKWRAVIDIDRAQGVPTYACIHHNAQALARYAALCQEANIVPIVEPEVLMDGGHDLKTCFDVTKRALQELFAELYYARVKLEGTILKPNMIVPGKKAERQASAQEIAEATVRCFREVVPSAVPGIVFLSGGQSEREATENLNAMNKLYGDSLPWKLSFSYGRALQASALEAWRGEDANVRRAQQAFDHRAKMNGLAQQGAWSEAVEDAA